MLTLPTKPHFHYPVGFYVSKIKMKEHKFYSAQLFPPSKYIMYSQLIYLLPFFPFNEQFVAKSPVKATQ
jgi:hypothetical protein